MRSDPNYEGPATWDGQPKVPFRACGDAARARIVLARRNEVSGYLLGFVIGG